MNDGSFLEKILAAASARLSSDPVSVDKESVRLMPPPPSFRDALTEPGLSVVAEIKRRSPSAGPLAPGLDPADQALAYAAGGAAAISVLTEPVFFDGSIRDLRSVAATVSLPVLRKDFIVAEDQIWQAREMGASAILLIVAALDDSALEHLLGVAVDAGVDSLVEVHTEGEARRARDAGADIIGVNNRDLTTFITDLSVAERIAPLVDHAITVAESGVSDPIAAARMAAAGYDAILVGEALVRSSDPADLVARLRMGTP